MNSVHINKKSSQVCYCLDCGEYRPTVIIETNIRDLQQFVIKSTKRCVECKSSNLREISNFSTGLKSKTEVK